ncbi:hypothetical protein N566_17815, partial [Streptomycetaceae bacterium MP113-05]
HLPTLRRDQPEVRSFLTTLATLHAQGATVRWARFFPDVGSRQLDLPTYPFQHQRLWLDGAPQHAAPHTSHPFVDTGLELADTEGLVLSGRLGLDTHPWLADHTVNGTVLVPGTALLELALHAAERTGHHTGLHELTLQAPLTLEPGTPVHLQVTVTPTDDADTHRITLHSRPAHATPGTQWTHHAEGTTAAPTPSPATPTAAWPPEGADALPVDDLYDELADTGLTYGPAFQGLRAAWRKGDDTYAEITLPTQAGDTDHYTLHPALLDAALHTIALGTYTTKNTTHLPFHWTGVHVHTTGTTALRTHLTPGPDTDTVTLTATDTTGTPVVTVERLTLRPSAAGGETLYGVEWVTVPGAAEARPGNWAVLGGSEWRPHPGCTSFTDLAALGDAVRSGTGPLPDAVFATLDEDHARPEPTADDVHTACAHALALLQGWLADEELAHTRLVLVTRPGGSELLRAPLHALVQVAESEHPGRFTLLDVGDDPAALAALPAALGSEPRLAVAADGRLTAPRLAPLPRTEPKTENDAGAGAVWGPEGTVLITGGTGALGGLLARHLVTRHGVRHLLLTNRQGPDAAAATALHTELTTLGATVSVAACDLTDPTAVAGLISSVGQDRPLTAVVHAAGTLDDALVTNLTTEQLRTVLAPKVAGTLNLHHATQDLPLRAFVLFSSITATLANPGQANYAAANAFLDALAHHRHAQGLPAQSIAWGLWNQPSGMTAHMGEADFSRIARSGMTPLTPERGLELFDSVAARQDVPGVAALQFEAAALRRRAAAGELPAPLRGLVRVPSASTTRGTPGGDRSATALRARLAELTPAARTKEVQDLIAREVSVALGHASTTVLAPTRDFKDLGFDSLTTVQLRNRLADATGLRLPATLLFDHPDAASLTDHLVTELADIPVKAATGPGHRSVAGAADEPIAIVGMSCRFPGGVTTPDELWDLVAEGRDAISPFPVNRGWDLGALYHPDPEHPGTSYTRHGGFLHDAGDFDADFFGISPREALAMDPQQRLLLETSWEALERAGLDPTALRGTRTGVFAGLMYHEYANGTSPEAEGVAGHLLTGNTGSVASGRVAYTFGFEGPAVTVDTACSSSLVALHLAAQSLRS